MPYPIDGNVYDSNGDAYAGAQVIIYNLTLNDSIKTTTNSSGYYFLDRANATKEWSNNEVIVIRAFVDGKYIRLKEERTTMTGSAIEQDLTMNLQAPDQELTIPIPQIELKEHDAIAKAKRVINVDEDGNDYNEDNPIPVSSVTHIATDIEGKGLLTLGTTAVEVDFSGITETISIQSATTNTGLIYIGKSDVTNLGANAIHVLDVGATFIIDYKDTTNAIYVVSDTVDQKYIAGAAK